MLAYLQPTGEDEIEYSLPLGINYDNVESCSSISLKVMIFKTILDFSIH
jgi:hypothetical protein